MFVQTYMLLKGVPLVDKLCKVNTHNIVEGCLSCHFFNFHVFTGVNVDTNKLANS